MTPPTPIDEIIRSSRRTVALVIRSDGRLTVRAPLRMPVSRIHEFVEQHSAWVRKKTAQIKANPPPPRKVYRTGETFLFQGTAFPLTIHSRQKSALLFDRLGFHLAEPHLHGARQVFIRWYQARARELFSERVHVLAQKYGFSYARIRISSARTRWGSCSSRGTLSFTWRLVMAPTEIIDYVVLHELVHTQVRNHSPKYWNRLAKIMPDYKRHVTWLKKNGRLLTLD